MKYIPSEKFINELVSSGFMKEQESAVQKEQKELDDLRYVMQIIEAGADYWDRLMQEGLAKNALSYADRTYLTQAKDFAEKAIIPQANSSGKVPMKVMQMAKAVLDVRDKLESLGIKV